MTGLGEIRAGDAGRAGGQRVPLLELDDLRTEIRLRASVVRALDGVSLQVQAGECLGIVGESGCGKTLTALSIMRLLPPGGHIAGGQVRLDGQEISSLAESGMRRIRGNEIGMIFQDPATSLNPMMTIGDQIAETVREHTGASRKAALRRATEVLGLVGMPRPAERVTYYPHQLSGGMRQRVMIAMALACEPRLLIADEPTTALDVTIQKQILELVDDLRRQLGMAMILITHDLGVIAGRTDRVAVMYAGKVAETASTLRLFANPRHPYTQALFEALPERAGASRRLASIPGMPPDLADPPPGCRFAPRCRYAQEHCVQSDPGLDFEVPDHAYRCLFPVGTQERAVRNAELTVTEVGAADPAQALASDDGGRVLLRADQLMKTYPVSAGTLLRRKVGEVSAVAGVSFSLRPGETFGLVGESGCGKSTIGHLLAGLETPTGGSIVLDGEELTALSARERRRRSAKVQLMFQDSFAAMDPRMRVGAILREPLAIHREQTRRDQHAAIAQLLGEVGLPASAVERYPHEFSGGQRQRIGLARALILRPRLIVADEPVSALDVSIQAQILNLMRDLQRQHGLAYLLISHDLAVVRYLSETIGVMYLGKLVEVGPADDVYTRPVHPYTSGLIDTIPVADPAAELAKAHKGVTGELPSAINPPSGCRFRTRCSRAQELCAVAEPPLRPFTPDGHLAACHFPLRAPSPLPRQASYGSAAATTDSGTIA